MRQPATRVESTHQCARHVRLWLAAARITYSPAAREAFVRRHPVLFGHAYEVTLRGYENWLLRHRFVDNLERFATFAALRHERWLAASGHTRSLPPCLLASQPCWQGGISTLSARIKRPAA